MRQGLRLVDCKESLLRSRLQRVSVIERPCPKNQPGIGSAHAAAANDIRTVVAPCKLLRPGGHRLPACRTVTRHMQWPHCWCKSGA